MTTKREAFYWSAVLFTFALGTAAGDLTAERLAVGYWKSALLFGALIAIVYIAHAKFGLNAILAFWIAYILTRPLGASIGDFLSQPRADGGLGLGTTITSVIFLLVILAVVIYLTITKKDRIERSPARQSPLDATSDGARILIVANKTAATPALIEAVAERAASGRANFFLLVPNPDHLVFDRNSRNVHEGEQVLELALPLLRAAADTGIEGRVAISPNAYDDIVAELDGGGYDEIILSTLPHHVSHWLHVDLPQRIAQLGYPVTTVTATRPAGVTAG